jgi:hypothetical protein
MAITIAAFKIRFPGFVSIDDTRIQVFLDDAQLLINKEYWGDIYELGVYYLTAHYLALALEAESISLGTGGSKSSKLGGPVNSRSVDGSSVSYAVNAADGDMSKYLSQTGYGAHFLYLMRTLGVAAYVI